MSRLFAIALFAYTAFSAAEEKLPVTPAETLSGTKVDFPTALQGKAAVCVFGFSKEAGDRARIWMTKLSQDGINTWSIANLEKAPAFIRGMIRSSMRKGTPATLLDHSLILTKDMKAWQDAVGAKHENLPMVVLLDPMGRILWTYEGYFWDQPLQELKSKLQAIPAAVHEPQP